LFKASRDSLVSRGLVKKSREEGFKIGRYRMRTVMRKLKLKVTQRIAYKVTTKRKHSDQVARDHMKEDVAYMKYHNLDRLHTANDGMSPSNFEKSSKESGQFKLTRTEC